MELYIEKHFIDNFYLEVDLKYIKPVEQVLINIFKSYGDIDCYMDVAYDSPAELLALKISNPFISYLFNVKGPLSISNIKDHFFKHSSCDQTLIFTHNEEPWHKEAEEKGAMCFSLESYSIRIKEILEWVDTLDLDIDEFNGWEIFTYMQKIPYNRLNICDNYILVDRQNQRIDQNLFPLLQVLLNNKETQNLPVNIFTKDFNATRPGTPDQIKEAAIKKHGHISSVFAKHKSKFKVFNTSFEGGYDIHGREVLNNFVIIRSGEGFNLIPSPKKSNETITAGCIFRKNDYKRINKRIQFYKNYENYLQQLETLNFKYYPG